MSAISIHQRARLPSTRTERKTLWSAAVLLEEGAELAEEIARQPAMPHPEHVKTAAAAKRQLAERVKAVVSDFTEIRLRLDQIDSHR